MGYSFPPTQLPLPYLLSIQVDKLADIPLMPRDCSCFVLPLIHFLESPPNKIPSISPANPQKRSRRPLRRDFPLLPLLLLPRRQHLLCRPPRPQPLLILNPMILPPGIPLLHIIDIVPANAIGFQGILPRGQFPQPDEIFPGLERVGEPLFFGREGVLEGGVAEGVFEKGDAGKGEEGALVCNSAS